MVDQLDTWLEQLRSTITPESRPEDRFVIAMLSAVLAHLYIAWIHPFGNGNGRLARLVEVQILSESGIVPLVATNLLSDHYNKTRPEYYLALDAAQRNVADFVKYAVRGFIGEIRGQVSEVRRESLEIHWESYVYEIFKSMPDAEEHAIDSGSWRWICQAIGQSRKRRRPSLLWASPSSTPSVVNALQRAI